MLQQSPNQYARRWPSFFLAVLIERLSSTPRYDIPPPKSRIKHPRACGSSARRSLADASVSHCRTVVRPLQRMRLERDADDNRTALITPMHDLRILVSRLTNNGVMTDVAALRIRARSRTRLSQASSGHLLLLLMKLAMVSTAAASMPK